MPQVFLRAFTSLEEHKYTRKRNLALQLFGVMSKSRCYRFSTSDVKIRAMDVWTILLFLGFSIFGSFTADVDDGVCVGNEGDFDEGSLVIQLVRDKMGMWKTSVMTNDMLGNSLLGTGVDISRKLFECEDQEVAVIKAAIAVPRKIQKNKLKFYPVGGKNVAVSEDGLTATRIDISNEGYAGILTDKPLENDQLFEVRLDNVIDRYTSSIGIGVSRFNPETSPYLSWMSAGTLMLYDNQFYEEQVVSRQQYGTNSKALKAGDRIGVMRKKNGALHFFINGEDQGIARTGVKHEIHGVVDLYANAVQASIV